MSTRSKRARKRQPRTPRSPVRPSRLNPVLINAQSALEECVSANALVKVTLHSLERQEIASPEQEVLKRALKALQYVDDWISKLRVFDLARLGTPRRRKS